MTLTYEGIRWRGDRWKWTGVSPYIKDEIIYVDTVKFAPTTWRPRIMIMNNEGLPLYYKIGPNPDATIPSGYTIHETELGGVGNGTVAEWDKWAGFERSTAPTVSGVEYIEDVLPIRVSVYEDSGYLDPYGEGEGKQYRNFDIRVRWINSEDAYWTTFIESDFDEGGSEGWTIPRGEVTSDKFLSPPYSLRTWTPDTGWTETYLKRTITLAGTAAYFILPVYFSPWGWGYVTSTIFCPRIKGITRYINIVPEGDGPWRKYVIPLTDYLPFSNEDVGVWIRSNVSKGHIYIYFDDLKIIYRP